MSRIKYYAAYVLLCLIWGSTWLFIKVGYAGLGPFNVAAIRFFVAGFLFVPLVPAFGAQWPRQRSEWLLVLFLGVVLFAGDYGFVYWTEQYLDSGLTAVLFAVYPLIMAVLAHGYIAGDRLSAQKLGGMFLALAGVAGLFATNLHIDASKIGPMVAVVLAALCGAAGTVAAKKHGHDLHPAALNAPAMLIGAVLLTLASILAGDGFHFPMALRAWGPIFYLSIAGSIVTFLIYFWLLKVWQPTTLSFISVFTPITALVLGYLVLGERPSTTSAIGAVLVLAGVAIALV